MQTLKAAKYLVLAGFIALPFAACRGRHESTPDAGTTTAAATADRVTEEELTRYLDWAVELRNQMSAAAAEAHRNLDDRDAFLAMFARRREEQAALMAREPFKGTRKGEAITGVVQTLYASGRFVSDGKELEKVRARYGRQLVDSVLVHESLIRDKLGSNPAPLAGGL
jgi:hypothetical protein